MKNIEEYKTTTSRSVYNKIHKDYLTKYSTLRCSYCKYHRGENAGKGYFINLPNWKLVSKKRKQWMEGSRVTHRGKTKYSKSDWLFYN